MTFSSADLARLATETAFQAEPLENALHLLELLDAVRSHPYLTGRMVLKGGTALNLFLLDLDHELVAGKLAALFGRSASRDLFDAARLLTDCAFDRHRLRLAFVLYGAMSRRDWRTVSIDDVAMDPRDAERRLLPLLRADGAPNRRELAAWCERLVIQCRDQLSIVLPLLPHEREFVALVNDRGEVVPEILTSDSDLQWRIRAHPALQWRARQRRAQERS